MNDPDLDDNAGVIILVVLIAATMAFMILWRWL
jgi:hypothetical protein